MSRTALLVPVLALAVLLPTAAEAGRRPFIWAYDTETVPERSVELEQWVWLRDGSPTDPNTTSLWWAPVLGLTDQLELSFPVEWYWIKGAGTNFETAGVDLRYRFLSPDPEKAGPVVPLLRAGVKRSMVADSWLLQADGVVSFDLGPSLHGALDLGFERSTGTVRKVAPYNMLRYSAGLSYQATDGLRAGAELFGEWTFTERDETGWVMAGPNISYTLSRFWLTGGLLIGLNRSAPAIMPRLIWAVEL